jgi:hypothetical protein
VLYPLSYGRNFTARASVSRLGRIGAVADTDIFTTQVPDGDFIVYELPPKWVVRRTVGDGASQTTWAFSGGEAPAVAQALIFARHDRTAAWMRLDHQRYRLIESFRP